MKEHSESENHLKACSVGFQKFCSGFEQESNGDRENVFVNAMQ